MHTGTCQHVEHWAGSNASASMNRAVPACDRCANPGFAAVHYTNGGRQLVQAAPLHITKSRDTICKGLDGLQPSRFGRDLEALKMMLEPDNHNKLAEGAKFHIHWGMK